MAKAKAQGAKLAPQAVKLSGETVQRLKNLQVLVQGVPLTTYEEKILHLMWVFDESKKNAR